ncbi:glycosyltransferase, partial [Candidatus Kaiserbacteria bacterium]|nr:glycosyltransferase [Candidatus Kaiserbacteria bacterium]
MKKKILIFSLAYYPKHIGGAEVAIKEITDRLSPEEYEFHLVCNRFDSTLPKEEKVENVTVHRIGLVTKSPDMGDLSKWPLHLNKLFYQFTSFGKAKKLHKIYRFDGIWAMMAHSTGVPAARFKQAYPSVQYVLNLQEGDPPEYIEKKMRVFGNWFKKAFTTADKIQVLSNFLARWARNMGYNKDIVLIPNGTDTTLFSRSLSEQSIKNTHDVVLVSTSRLVNKNALDDVI